jgi:hypothetical protein
MIEENRNIDPYRTIARIVGSVYLAGFVVGIVGNTLIQSILGATLGRLAEALGYKAVYPQFVGE